MNRTILVTGGAGFIGSHVSEYYAQRGEDVIVFDNLSRANLLGKHVVSKANLEVKNSHYNWDYLKRYNNIRLIKGDIRDKNSLEKVAKEADIIIHTAAQTAVTTSVFAPEPDFSINTVGTFNLLEAARNSGRRPTIIYCSTNKVYGANVNRIPVIEGRTCYTFSNNINLSKDFQSLTFNPQPSTFDPNRGIPESFSIDLCEHTPYGCSKLSGDLYMQDYAHLYGLKVGVFRMSCIYGTRQFGVEDQGWVAWFTIATILDKPITIYGDGKQVRDLLYVSDLVNAYDKFIASDLPYGVFNIGGGPENTLSLLELLKTLEDLTGKRSKIDFADWRPSDQKVYISDITLVKEKLNWRPAIPPIEGVKRLVHWVEENKDIF